MDVLLTEIHGYSSESEGLDPLTHSLTRSLHLCPCTENGGTDEGREPSKGQEAKNPVRILF